MASAGLENVHLVGIGQLRVCSACKAVEQTAGLFKRCSACQRAVYCGRDCQKAHWAAHRAVCKKKPQQPPPAAPAPPAATTVQAVVFPGDRKARCTPSHMRSSPINHRRNALKGSKHSCSRPHMLRSDEPPYASHNFSSSDRRSGRTRSLFRPRTSPL